MTQRPSDTVPGTRERAAQLAVFLTVFFVIWALRATVFYRIDRAITSPVWRAAYSDLLKLLLWVLPAAAFARVLRRARPAAYLGLSVWPDRRNWLVSLAVTAAFPLASAGATLAAGGRHLSLAGLAAQPAALWVLQAALTPLLEEILFRGLVQKEALALLPRPGAIVVTSALFAGTHLPFWLSSRGTTLGVLTDTGGVFVFSLVAGWLFARTRSVWPPALAHIANNLVASMLVAGRG